MLKYHASVFSEQLLQVNKYDTVKHSPHLVYCIKINKILVLYIEKRLTAVITKVSYNFKVVITNIINKQMI